MYYALVGFLAIILHFIINNDVIFKRGAEIASVTKDYRHYLSAVLAFYLVDMFWGILSQTSLTGLLYADTVAYYVTVTFTVIFWCRYVISYLNLGSIMARTLLICGSAFAIGAFIVLFINLFTPIIFEIDESGRFNSEEFRLAALLGQLIIFIFVSVQCFHVAIMTNGRARLRNLTIGYYCCALVLTVLIQHFFPLLPLYSMGLIIGTCVLHVYVQEDERAEIRKSEIRNINIIQALATSYEQVNYITMGEGTYSASCSNYDVSDEHTRLKTIQTEGFVQKAINYACSNLVSASFRNEVAEFSDLSTINSRMALTHMISIQFKNYNEVWYEWSYIVADRNPDGSINHLIWAVRKIEDEKQAEIRKQKILEDNIAANEAKTVFLQNMSHEIRTPLNAMFGFSQLLGMPEGTWTENERKEYNRYVLNSYYMMDMLINDIIDVSDSENGNYRIEEGDVNINEICRSALTSVEHRKPAEVDMRLTTDITDDFIIRTDGRRIQQVLVNLLTNACKHTVSGEIVLSCSSKEAEGKLVFAVTDTGEGIPEDKAGEIFQRFTKLNQFSQGSGLGLHICQTVAQKLGGEIYLDSTYKDGARFVFIINKNS